MPFPEESHDWRVRRRSKRPGLVLSRTGRGYGLKALRGRLLYGLREGRDRKRVQTNESENGGCVAGPFLGTPFSTLLPQEQLVNRKLHQRHYKPYLGVTECLTIDCLEQAAAILQSYVDSR